MGHWFMKFIDALNIINEEYQFGEANGIRFFIRFREGKIPHIHFVSKNLKRSGAILLEKPQYFPHGNPLKYTDILSKKECLNFNNMLLKPIGQWKTWHKLCNDWNNSTIDGNKIEIYKNGKLVDVPGFTKIVYPL